MYPTRAGARARASMKTMYSWNQLCLRFGFVFIQRSSVRNPREHKNKHEKTDDKYFITQHCVRDEKFSATVSEIPASSAVSTSPGMELR